MNGCLCVTVNISTPTERGLVLLPIVPGLCLDIPAQLPARAADLGQDCVHK